MQEQKQWVWNIYSENSAVEQKTNRQVVKGKARSSEGFPLRFRKLQNEVEGSNFGIRLIKSGIGYDYRHRMRLVTSLH